MVKVKLRGISPGASGPNDADDVEEDGVDDRQRQDVQITVTRVTQDEPVSGLGEGDMSPDAILSGNHVLLRAERSETGDGRVYTVHFTATKGTEPGCTAIVKVQVRRNKKDPAIEGTELYDSFGP